MVEPKKYNLKRYLEGMYKEIMESKMDKIKKRSFELCRRTSPIIDEFPQTLTKQSVPTYLPQTNGQ